MNFATPDRNVLIGALAAVFVYILDTIGARYGLAVTPELATAMPILIGFLIAHFVPLSKIEVAAKTDNEVVKLAENDPNNPTDLSKVIDDKIVHKAQMDPNSDVSFVIPPVPVPKGEAKTIIPPADKNEPAPRRKRGGKL